MTVATAIEACDPLGPTPAHKNWRHANWLNRVSVANKQDFARLQGFDFVMTDIKVRGGTPDQHLAGDPPQWPKPMYQLPSSSSAAILLSMRWRAPVDNVVS